MSDNTRLLAMYNYNYYFIGFKEDIKIKGHFGDFKNCTDVLPSNDYITLFNNGNAKILFDPNLKKWSLINKVVVYNKNTGDRFELFDNEDLDDYTTKEPPALRQFYSFKSKKWTLDNDKVKNALTNEYNFNKDFALSLVPYKGFLHIKLGINNDSVSDDDIIEALHKYFIYLDSVKINPSSVDLEHIKEFYKDAKTFILEYLKIN